MINTKSKNLNKGIFNLQKILQPNRIRILFILDKKETCACELIKELKLANNLISHHLKTLVNLKILKSRKIGLHRKYSIKKNKKIQIHKLLKCLQSYSNENK